MNRPDEISIDQIAPDSLPAWLRPAISLAYRNYRLVCLSQFCSGLAYWMELATTGWLVFHLTGSGLFLGVVTGARSLPLLALSMVGGVFADRFNRQRLLSVSQTVAVMVNLILGLLVATGLVNEWHLLLGSLASGAAIAFQNPARQSLISQIVPRAHLLNAVAMNGAAINLSRSFGPAVAGAILAVGGPTFAYGAQTVAYLAAFFAILFVRLPQLRRSPARGSVRTEMLDGLRYAAANRVVLGLLLVALVPQVLGQPYISLMPIFAVAVLGIGASGLGLLLAAPGLGALLGLAWLAAAGDRPHQGNWAIAFAVAFGLSLVGFALSPWLGLSLPLLVLSGLCQTATNSLVQALLQMHTPDSYRGRVMSLYLLDRGLTPFGSVLAGGTADLLGAPAAIALMAGAAALLSLATALRLPEIRKL